MSRLIAGNMPGREKVPLPGGSFVPRGRAAEVKMRLEQEKVFVEPLPWLSVGNKDGARALISTLRASWDGWRGSSSPRKPSDYGKPMQPAARIQVSVTFVWRYWQVFPKSNIASLPGKINVPILL